MSSYGDVTEPIDSANICSKTEGMSYTLLWPMQ
jgi:hypothetical protein